MLEEISVIIPCYNQGHHLSDALKSIIGQTYSHWKCYIVNDGSSDNTREVAMDWGEKDKRINYLFQENKGLSSARNLGISKSKGRYILTLDADDKYEKTFMEKGIAILGSKKKVGIVSSWGRKFIGEKLLDQFEPIGGDISAFLFKNASIGTSLFRRKCWEQVGGYDENMKKGYEDWEFYIRVCKEGWTAFIIEEELFFYRQHQKSMKSEARDNYDRELKEYVYLKHKDLYIENYDKIIAQLLYEIQQIKTGRNTIKSSIDYRLGSIVLSPFRRLKNLLKF